jgi:hypothetical protein
MRRLGLLSLARSHNTFAKDALRMIAGESADHGAARIDDKGKMGGVEKRSGEVFQRLWAE